MTKIQFEVFFSAS